MNMGWHHTTRLPWLFHIGACGMYAGSHVLPVRRRRPRRACATHGVSHLIHVDCCCCSLLLAVYSDNNNNGRASRPAHCTYTPHPPRPAPSAQPRAVAATPRAQSIPRPTHPLALARRIIAASKQASASKSTSTTITHIASIAPQSPPYTRTTPPHPPPSPPASALRAAQHLAPAPQLVDGRPRPRHQHKQ